MPLELVCPDDVNKDGAFRLEWKGGGPGSVYEVTEGGAPLYRGADLATTVTGRPKGAYAYEVSWVGSESAPVRCDVVVEPHSLGQAFGLFGLGAFVFACTLVVVVRGHRAHRAGRIG